MKLGATLGLRSECRLCFLLADDILMTDGVYQWHQVLAHDVPEHRVRLTGLVVKNMFAGATALMVRPLS
jgi:hypothetical protein